MSGAPFNESAINRKRIFLRSLTRLADDFILGNGKMPVNDQEISLCNGPNTLSSDDGEIREKSHRSKQAGGSSALPGGISPAAGCGAISESLGSVSALVGPLFVGRRKSNGA
ncbi:hypothetical protein [Burkholderia oklahomensis]|uniref:hypothetical protein n=1 Tax=Burkholderia oklahomensis TaxID=342113 RepID=UPI000A76F0D7|nr:hypothetical protein [Burkholderia oklahomensis]MBI0360612.1 hypothetical protein [Burkholderia oklahomensis]